jgi:hypothetical protein
MVRYRIRVGLEKHNIISIGCTIATDPIAISNSKNDQLKVGLNIFAQKANVQKILDVTATVTLPKQKGEFKLCLKIFLIKFFLINFFYLNLRLKISNATLLAVFLHQRHLGIVPVLCRDRH